MTTYDPPGRRLSATDLMNQRQLHLYIEKLVRLVKRSFWVGFVTGGLTVTSVYLLVATVRIFLGA